MGTDLWSQKHNPRSLARSQCDEGVNHDSLADEPNCGGGYEYHWYPDEPVCGGSICTDCEYHWYPDCEYHWYPFDLADEPVCGGHATCVKHDAMPTQEIDYTTQEIDYNCSITMPNEDLDYDYNK